ncbi:fetuin-B-like [Arapaima gigas]
MGRKMVTSWAQTQAHPSAADVVPVPCNDKTVEKLARLALSYVNEDRTVGYKFSLNRVLNVHLHAQGPAGKVYYLDLDVLETKCHVRSPKPWKRCDIRPFMETQITGNCNTTILHTPHGFSYLYSYDCVLIPDQPEKLLKTCPDCPVLLSTESAEALQAAHLTLRKHNTQSPLGSHFRLQSITRASQNAALQGTFVEYTIQETECSLEQEDAGLCKPADLHREPAGFCIGAVYGNGKTETDLQVSCEIFHPQGVGMSNSAVGGARHKQVPDALPAQHEKPPKKVPKDPVPKDPQHRLFDSVQKADIYEGQGVQPTVPVQPTIVLEVTSTPLPPIPSQKIPDHSSESNSESSEELATIIVRPPQDFRYKALRPRRQASPSERPEHIPEFLAIFPSARSPFRSCPGAPRYTTA